MASVFATLPNGHLAVNNNEVYTVALVFEDAVGNKVPMPNGDTITPSTTGPHASSIAVSATMAVFPGISTSPIAAVAMSATVVESDASNSGGGVQLVLTDTAALTENPVTVAYMFDVVVPPPGPAVSEGIDITNVLTSPQPTPTAPGP